VQKENKEWGITSTLLRKTQHVVARNIQYEVALEAEQQTTSSFRSYTKFL